MNQPKSYGDPGYAMTRHLGGISFADATSAVRSALAAQGFGVLTEIDIKATMQKKLGVEYRNYLILGACNPPLANRALAAEPGVGVLLPCNVVVAEDADGDIAVSAVDPRSMFSVVGRADIEPVVEEVRTRLQSALDALAR